MSSQWLSEKFACIYKCEECCIIAILFSLSRKSPIEDQTEKEYATSTQMDQSTVSSDEDMDVTENLIGQPTKLISSELKQLSLTDANTEQIDSVRLKRFKTLKGLIL